MSGELEAAGALATAGAVAGAIEPGDPGAAGEGPCLNCGAPLAGGRYCSQCGQAARPHRTLGGMVGEFLASLWNLDTKAWRTLPRLLFRPGTLTREYIYGKRARYISPLTAFLLRIFLMFFAFSTIDMPSEIGRSTQISAGDVAQARSGLEEARTELQRVRANPNAPPGLEGRLSGVVAVAEARVERMERELERQQEMQSQRAAAVRDVTANPSAGQNDLTVKMSVAGEPVPEGSTWQDELRAAVDRGDVHPNLGHPALNERALQTLRNPDLAMYQIQDATSKFSFLLAPLSLPFIALLFLWKRGVTLYDHMSFALYGLAFAALLFSSIALIGRIPGIGWTATWLALALPLHMYFQLKGAYALGWWSALWRTFFLIVFAMIVASIFFSLVIILGLAG